MHKGNFKVNNKKLVRPKTKASRINQNYSCSMKGSRYMDFDENR